MSPPKASEPTENATENAAKAAEPAAAVLTPEAPAQPELVKVTVAGKELSVPSDAAEAIAALTTQLEELRSASPARAEPAALKPTKSASSDYDYSTELFLNPKEALTRLRAEVKTEILNEVQSAQARVAAQTAFWSEFYGSHPDLKDFDIVVRAVLDNEYSTYQNMTVAKTITKLGESVKAMLLKATKTAGRSDDGPVVEGGAAVRGTSEALRASGEITSLSDVIRARQAARNKPRLKA